MTDTDLTTVDDFIVPPNDALEVIAVNNHGRAITLDDFKRITIPSGGKQTWTVASSMGDQELEVLEGVIVHTQTTRAYFEGAYDPHNNDPPLCSSQDGSYGFPGVQGITDCTLCPMNQFETANGGRGKGKACAEHENVFLQRSGDGLPVVIRISPGSLTAWRGFMGQLTSEAVRRDRIITSVGLERKGSGNTAYSVATFKKVGDLNDSDFELLFTQGRRLEGLLAPVAAPEVATRAPEYSDGGDPPHPAGDEDPSWVDKMTGEIDPNDLPFE
jgi:hypothetical protein|tara:strand:+ start:6697 stop:7512 length:816 start_codon:yes stop_codon:yes gene_type:complete